jgi:BON domain
MKRADSSRMAKSDIQLKQDIEAELLWDPQINAAQIGVSVDHGAVALSGQVDSYPPAQPLWLGRAGILPAPSSHHAKRHP